MSAALAGVRAALEPRWVSNELWRRARAVPSVDFNFDSGSMLDLVSGQGLITYTRPSLAWGWNGSQFVQFANDTPRIVVDPATGLRGLLVEEGRTNLLLNSANAANASWVKSGTASVTDDNAAGLISGVLGDTVSVTAGGANRITASCVVSTSTTYTLYAIVRAGNINGLTVRGFFSGGTTVDTYADFTFSTGLFTNVIGAGTFSARSLDAQHWLLSCVVASGNNTAAELRLSGLITAAQTGTTFVHIHSQIEAGAFPTSPIITTGSALTRSADVAVVSGANFSSWFNPVAGTLFTDAYRSDPVPANTFPVTFDTRNVGVPTNQFQISYLTEPLAGSFVRTASAVQAELYPAGMTGVRRRRMALAAAENNFAASANGSAVLTDSSGVMPSGIDRANIGSAGSGAQALNGIITRATYWPTRLPNATLQALTSA